MAGIKRPGDRVIRHHSRITPQTDKLYAIVSSGFSTGPTAVSLRCRAKGSVQHKETFTSPSFTPNFFKTAKQVSCTINAGEALRTMVMGERVG